MKTIKAVSILVLATILCGMQKADASDWSQVVNLEGTWSFMVGDNSKWSNPSTSILDWDKIHVPCEWEDYYPNYDGFAWYRRDFDITILPGNGLCTLFLGRIDDVDEVFINGIKVGQCGEFTPNFKSAHETPRIYKLPKGLLRQGKNTIAVRVYDEMQRGGMLGLSGTEFEYSEAYGNKYSRAKRQLGIYIDNDNELISLDLSGQWKFSTFRERNFYKEDFNDSRWASINVPAKWESQGYNGYDGYAWYRKKFTMPTSMSKSGLYLILGRIDDLDKVYLNGERLGRTEDLRHYHDTSKPHLLYRVYRIPSDMLKRENVIAIEVYDKTGSGGIYEGPIGLATQNDAAIIQEREVETSSSLPSFIRNFFE